MQLQYTPYILPILIALIISQALSIWGWRKRPAPGAAWFAVLMFLSFLFSLFYGLEILSVRLKAVIFWSQMQYFGAINISIMWLFLVMTYTGKRDWLTRHNIGLLYIIPTITLILAWTNQFHELIWINPYLKNNPAFSVLGFTPGIWWWVNIIYGNLFFIAATILLVTTLMHSEGLYKQQIITLLLFSLINWLGTGVYVLGLTPHSVNPTSLTFSIGGLLIAWGLFRYRIIDITPIAKDKIINEMKEGLVVLDAQNRIVEINPLGQEILGLSQSDLIGKPLKEILSEYPELEESLCHDEGDSDQHAEITLLVKNMGMQSFDIRISLLRDKNNHITGRLMFWHNITERVKQEKVLNLLLSIIQEVNTIQDFRASINKAIEIIVKQTDWTFGEAWIPNGDRSQLENANASYYNGVNLKELERFNKLSLQFSFFPNKGLPGRVWTSKKMEWQDDISSLPRDIYRRVQYAKEAKLKATLGIPVLDKGKVIVILVFYMSEALPKDQYEIGLVSAATAQLGAILQNKRAEEIMHIQSAALEATSNGIIITDKTGSITWANSAFSQLTGYSLQEIIGVNPNILKSGMHPPDFYRHLWGKISSGQTWQGEVVNRRKDSTLYIEEQTITPTRNKDGEITHFIAIKKDITQRKEFEKKIQEQNSFLRNIIESVANPFYVINVKDYSIEIANSAARALGVKRTETCYAITHKRETPCNDAEHPCPLKTVRETKNATSVEHIHLDSEGNSRIMEVHGYPITNEAGEVIQMIEYSLDITARKIAEEALKESEEKLRASDTRYRLLADNSNDMIWTMDLDMRLTYVSPSVRLHRGYSAEEALKLSLEETLPPTSLQEAKETFMIALATIQESAPEQRHAMSYTQELENYCKDGSTIWVEVTMSFLLDENMEAIGIIGTSRNISERKRAEDELRILSRAVEQSGSTVVITDLKGKIEFTNPAFSNVTGYTFEEAVGKNTSILKSGKHSREFYQDLWDTIKKGEIWQGEMLNRKKDGQFYWERATISPVQDDDGTLTHYLAVKEDITKRKTTEEALSLERLKTDELLKNILPEKIVEEIKETGRAKPVLYESTSILFTDFSNFTSTAEELSPDELVKLIDHYFTFFDAIIEKHKLEKLKTIGDSYMCASGLPTATNDHATRIVSAALDMLKFVAATKEEHKRKKQPFWDIRIGISSGSVVAGVVGRKKYAYDVWGDTVVMAARMEQSGKIGKVNISEKTYKLIKNDFNCEYRGKVAAKHKGEVKMYFVNEKKRD